jgi:hypothetical protein
MFSRASAHLLLFGLDFVKPVLLWRLSNIFLSFADFLAVYIILGYWPTLKGSELVFNVCTPKVKVIFFID